MHRNSKAAATIVNLSSTLIRPGAVRLTRRSTRPEISLSQSRLARLSAGDESTVQTKLSAYSINAAC